MYLILCGDGSLYTGISVDPTRRFEEHRRGVRGARYLRGRGPLSLLGQARAGSQGLALRVERRLKRLTRRQKLALLAEANGLEKLIRAERAAGRRASRRLASA